MNIPMNQMYVWMYVYTYVCICICVYIYIYIILWCLPIIPLFLPYSIHCWYLHSVVSIIVVFGRVFLVRHCTGSLSVPPVPVALLRTSLGNGFQIYGI